MPAVRKTRQPAAIAKPATAPRRPPAAPSAPKPGKGELQAQVEKLERTVATLRSSLTRAAEGSVARIEELERRMAQLEEAAVTRPAPTTQKSKPARVPRGKRQSGDADRGDAVPPGVAVSDPSPPDEDAETDRGEE